MYFELKSPPSEFRINWISIGADPNTLVVSALTNEAYAHMFRFFLESSCAFIQISSHFLHFEMHSHAYPCFFNLSYGSALVFKNVFSDIIIAYFLPIPHTHCDPLAPFELRHYCLQQSNLPLLILLRLNCIFGPLCFRNLRFWPSK
jgi:hypothetical protein